MMISARLIAKNSAFNLVGQALPSIVAIIVLPFLVHSLGEERFGLFMLIWAIKGFLHFLSFRLSFTLTKFASEAIYKGENEKLAQLTWTITLLLSALGGVGGLILAVFAFSLFTNVFQIPTQLWAEARTALLLTTLSVPLTLSSTGFKALLQAGQRFGLANLVYATMGCLKYVLAVALAVKGFRLPAIITALLLIDFVSFIVYLALCVKLYPSIRVVSVNIRSSRPLLWFGGWLSVSQVVGMGIQYLDRFIIGLLLPVAYLTYYAIPVEIINRLSLLPQSLSRAAFPALSAQGKSKYSIQLYARMMKFTLVTITPLALITFLFSEELLTFYLGRELALRSSPVLQLLLFGFLLGALGSITHNFVLALGHPDSVAKFHLIELPLYAGIAFWLTAGLGIQGMVLAWVLRKLLECGYIFLLLQRVAPQSIYELASNGMGRAVAASGALGLFVLLMFFMLLRELPAVSVLAMSIGMVAYSIVAWRYVLHFQERKNLVALIMHPFKS